MLDTQRMEKFHRRKTQSREQGNRDSCHPSWRFKQIQIKGRKISDRRKTAKIIVRSLHLAVGKIERTTNDDNNPRRNRKRLRHKSACGDRVSRNEDIRRHFFSLTNLSASIILLPIHNISPNVKSAVVSVSMSPV